MAHQWEEAPHPTHLMGGPCRRCVKCKAFQTREAVTWWMRTVGYRWWPRVGRCPADRKKNSFPRQLVLAFKRMDLRNCEQMIEGCVVRDRRWWHLLGVAERLRREISELEAA